MCASQLMTDSVFHLKYLYNVGSAQRMVIQKR